MLEERLKKVDTLQKAKDYNQMHDRHPLRQMLKSSQEAEDIIQRFDQMANDEMQGMVDTISSRLDEMLDQAHSAEQFEQLKPSFITDYSEEISEMAMDHSMEDSELKLFFDMLHLEMEEKIQEHEMGDAENEDANHHDMVRPEHVKALMLVKIKAFGNMLRETSQKTFELYNVRKQSKMDIEEEEEDNKEPKSEEEEESKDEAANKEDQPMKEDENEKAAAIIEELIVKKEELSEEDADASAAAD